MKRLLIILLACLWLSGCGGLRLEIPTEFRGKKQIEDPPLSRAPGGGTSCAA